MNKVRGRPRQFDRRGALDTVMNVFWEKGYEGAALSDLTSATGLGSTSLYAAFGSKEDLFREALAIYRDMGVTEVWSALSAAGTARDGIEAVLKASAQLYTKPDRPHGCMIMLGTIEGAASRDVTETLAKLRGQTVTAFEARLRRGQTDGEFGDHVDCHSIATFYSAVLRGMAIMARDGASREMLETIAANSLAGWARLTG